MTTFAGRTDNGGADDDSALVDLPQDLVADPHSGPEAVADFDGPMRDHPSAESFRFYIPRPPPSGCVALLKLGQHVNAVEFEGRAPGTVLLDSIEFKAEDRYAKLNFMHCAEGWNSQFDASTGSWRRANRYHEADFSALAKQKVDVTDCDPSPRSPGDGVAGQGGPREKGRRSGLSSNPCE